MIKKIYLNISLIFLVTVSVAQQDPMYTNYMFNTLAVNPAYAGTRDMISALLLSRHQWTGFEGAPTTQTFQIHSPVTNFNSGVGLSLVNDEIGPVHQNAVYVDYAYHVKVNENATLSMGLNGGFNLLQSNFTELYLDESNDQSFGVDIESKMMPNVGVGMYYYSHRGYFGLSLPKMIKNSFSDADVSNSSLGKEERHYFLMGGVVINAKPGLAVKPSFLAKVVEGAPLQLDFTLNFFINEKVWVGGMYRIGDAAGLLVQYQFNDHFRAGYAYDLTTSEMRKYNSGTHEIMLGYDFTLQKNKIVSPRYF